LVISESSLPPESGRSSGSPAPRSLISRLLVLSCVLCCSLVLVASPSGAAFGGAAPISNCETRRDYPTRGV
jgi:hypothetical protein